MTTNTDAFNALLSSMTDEEMEQFAAAHALPSDAIIATQTRNIQHKIASNNATQTFNTAEETSILESK